MAVSEKDMDVGGITISLFGTEELKARAQKRAKIVAVIVAHGRTGTRKDMAAYCRALCSSNSPSRSIHMIALSFDQRNHGHRLVDAKKNGAWAEGNISHSSDMFSVQYGTACDASFLVDVFPAFAGITPDVWAISGVSLGGHATLLALVRDPRFAFAVPIIGCGDFETLMNSRWNNTKAELRPDAAVSKELKSILVERDPVHNVARFKDRPLIFIAGGKDKLVPMAASTRFLSALSSQNGDLYQLFVDEKTGHAFSKEMMDVAIGFTWKWGEMLGKAGSSKL